MIIYIYSWAQLLHFSGDISTKKPSKWSRGFRTRFHVVSLQHACVFTVVNRVMPVVLNRAIHMLCVNLLAHSRAFRGSQQCRALYIQEKKVHVNIHIDMQISPHICSKW